MNLKVWPFALGASALSMSLWLTLDPGYPGGIDFVDVVLAVAILSLCVAVAELLWRKFSTQAKKVISDLSRPKITSHAGLSTADELAKWARLRDTGVVSEEEFQAARAELLKAQRS